MTDKVAVRFIKSWRGYSSGEVAVFDESVAEGLQAKSFAEVHVSDDAGGQKTKAKKTSSKPGAAKPGAAPAAATVPGAAGEGGEGGGENNESDDNDADEKP